MTRPINAKYRTIVESELAGAQLRVKFANGDVVKVPLKRVAPEVRDHAAARVRSHAGRCESAGTLIWEGLHSIPDH